MGSKWCLENVCDQMERNSATNWIRIHNFEKLKTNILWPTGHGSTVLENFTRNSITNWTRVHSFEKVKRNSVTNWTWAHKFLFLSCFVCFFFQMAKVNEKHPVTNWIWVSRFESK